MYAKIHSTWNGNKSIALIKEWSFNMAVSYQVVFCDHDKKTCYRSNHRKPEIAINKYLSSIDVKPDFDQLFKECLEA